MSDRKEQIINATIRLFAKDGVGVATSSIAKEAGVSNGTLFNYFSTKQDLIDGVYLFIKEEMADAIIGTLDGDVEIKALLFKVWGGYIAWALGNPLQHETVELLKTSQLLGEDVKQAGQELWATVFEAFEKGIQDKILMDVPVFFLCELAAGQLNATLSYIQNHNSESDNEQELVEKSFEIYWNGIKA